MNNKLWVKERIQTVQVKGETIQFYSLKAKLSKLRIITIRMENDTVIIENVKIAKCI